MKKLIIASIGVVAIVAFAVVWLRAAPTVGAVAATPVYIVISTPTQVTITAVITDPTLLPGGVNLLQTDATGKTLSTIGVMHDDGLNGDATANDKVFSYRVTVNQAAVGQTYYRASAAFKGVLQRSLSTVVLVHVDPFPLPPDPGPAGNQTVAGIDSDNDGVRDDVQRFIALTYYTSPRALAGAMQFGRSAQTFISSQTPASANALSGAQACLWGINPNTARTISTAIRAQELNTTQRFTAWDAANAAIGGHEIDASSPSKWLGQCTFNALSLPK